MRGNFSYFFSSVLGFKPRVLPMLGKHSIILLHLQFLEHFLYKKISSKKKRRKPGMVVHAYNPSTGEAEAGG
jgi:hypothetical protein